MKLKFPLSAATDEFSPNLDIALPAMKEIGFTGADLRTVGTRNILDLSDEEVARVRSQLETYGIQAVSIATPIMKCLLPGVPEVDPRADIDTINFPYRLEDQPKLTRRAFEIARRLGASFIRVFSFWRSVDPVAAHPMIQKMLAGLAAKAAQENLVIAVENDPNCNAARTVELVQILNAVNHPNLQVQWNPANALMSGDKPFPDAYVMLPRNRIGHVVVKDCRMENHSPSYLPVGTGSVDWRGQIAALQGDGYHGYLSLDTHWAGPQGDKLLASRVCGWNLKSLASH